MHNPEFTPVRPQRRCPNCEENHVGKGVQLTQGHCCVMCGRHESQMEDMNTTVYLHVLRMQQMTKFNYLQSAYLDLSRASSPLASLVPAAMRAVVDNLDAIESRGAEPMRNLISMSVGNSDEPPQLAVLAPKPSGPISFA